MGNDDWVEGYRAAVSSLLAQKGEFVRLDAYDTGRSWVPEGEYDDIRVTYGWHDWDHHLRECGIQEWHLESLRERSLSQFQGTFTGNTDEVGIEMNATCKCGKYTNRWVRYVGTLGEALEIVLRGGS
jgi:hypothetical protein